MNKNHWGWVIPSALLAAMALAGCGGGGGGSSPSNPSPTPAPGPPSPPPAPGPSAGPFTLTATPAHGAVLLTWNPPAGATSATTYTIQRASTANPAAGDFHTLPAEGGGGPAVIVGGTTYQDATYPNNTFFNNINFVNPDVGSQYTYRVVASSGEVSPTAAATPLGPGLGYFIPTTSDGTATVAPYAMPDSQAHFTYTIKKSDPTHPVVRMQIIVDYPASKADFRNITLNVAGDATAPGQGDQVYNRGNSNLDNGLTINPSNNREIDFDSSQTNIPVPVVNGYAYLTLNAFVHTTAGGTDANARPVQFTVRTPGVGQTGPVVTPPSSVPYASRFSLQVINQANGT